MIIKYITVKYSYLKINNKIKNEFSYIYEDKYLNDSIFVLNSNLIRQSFLRKKHLKPWWFTLNSKNISIYKIFSNKWDIFNIYPIKYTKKLYNERLSQEKFYYLFYRKYLKAKRYTQINFKYFRRDIKYLIKWRNKQRFIRVFSFYKVFKRVKRFWRRRFFMTYQGHIFALNRRFIRLKVDYSFFRKPVRIDYKNYFFLIKYMTKLCLNMNNFDDYSLSKLIIYYYYLLYLGCIIKFEFNILKRIRLNKKGPFYSIFKFKQKPMRIITFFFKELGFFLSQKKTQKILKFKNTDFYKNLQFYYIYYKLPENVEDIELFYLEYLDLYKNFNTLYKNSFMKSISFIDLWNVKERNFFRYLKMETRRFWKKFRKHEIKKRLIFKQKPFSDISREILSYTGTFQKKKESSPDCVRKRDDFKKVTKRDLRITKRNSHKKKFKFKKKNMIKVILSNIFSMLILLTGGFTILTKNPVHSVFYLILTFVNATLLLLLLHIEFIAMLFLVVYIGAISVLFLFVVMMLNIKLVELKEKIIQYLPIGFFILIIFFFEVYYMCNSSIFILNDDFLFMFWRDLNNLILINENLLNFYILLDTFNNISILAQILYTKFLYLFLISGLILLVAMLGAILLTLNQSFESKRQDLHSQINRKLENTFNLKRLQSKKKPVNSGFQFILNKNN